MSKEHEAELSIEQLSQECAEYEAQRLGRIIQRNVEVVHRELSPTQEVEQNWNRVRWGNPDA